MTSVEFARLAHDGRQIVRRILEDWPYQPPEVIDPERQMFAEWLEHPSWEQVNDALEEAP